MNGLEVDKEIVLQFLEQRAVSNEEQSSNQNESARNG